MSVEAIGGVGLLIFTILCTLVGGSYKLGQHSNRIESLEQRQNRADVEKREADAAVSDIKAEMSGVRAEVRAMGNTLSAGLANLEKLFNRSRNTRSGS
jgi:F0F1-type ATP synthase membrane subunit b/b'